MKRNLLIAGYSGSRRQSPCTRDSRHKTGISFFFVPMIFYSIIFSVCAGQRALDQRTVLLRHRSGGREGKQGADQVNIYRDILVHVLNSINFS